MIRQEELIKILDENNIDYKVSKFSLISTSSMLKFRTKIRVTTKKVDYIFDAGKKYR